MTAKSIHPLPIGTVVRCRYSDDNPSEVGRILAYTYVSAHAAGHYEIRLNSGYDIAADASQVSPIVCTCAFPISSGGHVWYEPCNMHLDRPSDAVLMLMDVFGDARRASAADLSNSFAIEEAASHVFGYSRPDWAKP